jgi:hypothetical protein
MDGAAALTWLREAQADIERSARYLQGLPSGKNLSRQLGDMAHNLLIVIYDVNQDVQTARKRFQQEEREKVIGQGKLSL